MEKNQKIKYGARTPSGLKIKIAKVSKVVGDKIYLDSGDILDSNGEVDNIKKIRSQGDWIEVGVNETNTTASAGGEYQTPFAFRKSVKVPDDPSYRDTWKQTNKWFIKPAERTKKLSEIISEISYNEFKSNPDLNNKQKINSSIKEINRRLYEIEKSLHQVYKLKNEIGAGQDIYLKETVRKFQKISERLLKISSKIREINK